jgi:hypothetical protein
MQRPPPLFLPHQWRQPLASKCLSKFDKLSAKAALGVERGAAHAHAQDVAQHHARKQHLRNNFVVELGRLERVCQHVDGVDLVQRVPEAAGGFRTQKRC